MSFISSVRARRQTRRAQRSGRTLHRAVAANSSNARREELVLAADRLVGLPPRL